MSISSSDRGRILVVDDDQRILDLLVELLGQEGYEVSAAKDGAEALKLALSFEPDVVISDVVMPGMSGREVSLFLTSTRKTIRTLYVSGYPDKSIVQLGVLEEGVAFLAKPFTADGLARKVREVLDAPAVGSC